MIERVEVVAGQGTVIRYGAVVAWAAPSASPALISFLAQSARNLSGSARGGRQMADHIAGVLQERDPEPHVAFAVVGPDALGWASLLHGPVQAWDGQRWLAPSPSPGWLQAIITPQPSVMVNSAGAPVPSSAPDSMWDLEAGVVPGSGFVLFPTPARSADLGAAEAGFAESEAVGGYAGAGDAGVEAGSAGVVAGSAGVVGGSAGMLAAEETEMLESSPPTEVLEAVGAGPEGGLEAEAEAGFEREAEAGFEPETEALSLLEPAMGPGTESEPEPSGRVLERVAPGPPGSVDLRRGSPVERRPPLPDGFGPDRSVPGAPVVGGVLCDREHLNRPGMRACVRCGAPVRTDNTYMVTGTRPPLGCLVSDDGTLWRLDAGYLVGSNPAADPTARGGIARPMTLEGTEMSPAHAEIRLAGWDVEVVDRSSSGGTFVFEPGAQSWERLRPYEPRTLRPGTHVAFGQRIVTFLTPWIAPANGANAS